MPDSDKAMEASKVAVQVLELLQIPRVGQAAARDVVRASIATGESDLLKLLCHQRAAPKILSESILRNARAAAADIIARCSKAGIHLVSMLDPGYPATLKSIEDAPPIIFVKGQPSALLPQAAAVVGTRDSSKRGEFAAFTVGRTLADMGVCVVSGLALGIDTAAHSGALDRKGTTVAILAHGLDTVTPASNTPLADRILDHGGALVSEHPPGTPPRKAEYVRRNRIQSGMSKLSIVVESGESGGSIHQASFARDQRRPLFVVYPDRTKEKEFNFAGADILIARLGAKPIAGTRDLRRIVGELMKPQLPPDAVQNEITW